MCSPYCSICACFCFFSVSVRLSGAVWCARLNPSATCAATAAADFSSKLWDALTGSELHQFAHKHIVKTCAFSTDGKQLITGGHEKKVRLFDLNKPESDPQIFEDHKATISNVWSLPDPTLFISAAAEKDIRVWDKRTGSVAHRISTNGEVRYCQTTLDGSVLSVCTTGKMVHFYSTESRDLIKSFEMPREIDCIAYDAVHQRFITGSSQELWVRCYDFKSGEEIACNKGHHGPVRSLAFNPNYTTYASGSEDGTIRIWSWAGIEEQMANMKLSGREDKEKGEKAIQRQ